MQSAAAGRAKNTPLEQPAVAIVDPAALTFVRRAVHDCLHRTPTPAEVRGFVGAPVAQVAERLLGQLEAKDEWLEEELFYLLLLDGFRPQTDAVRAIPQRLHEQGLSVRDATAEILLSTGFSLRNPGNDTFVTVVLEQCLGLTVQQKANHASLAAGKTMYDGRPARLFGQTGNSQADFVKIVLHDRQFTHHLLDRHHQRLFGKALPKDEQANALVQRVHDQPAEFFTVLAAWLASPAYQSALTVKRLRSDRQFVRGLYVDLLERRPTYEELRNMRNALQAMADPAPLRSVLAKVILDSGKAKLPELSPGQEAAFVAACFRRYLGRDPQPAEEARFVTLIRAGGGTPAQVVRALVGSAEYQYC